MDPQQLTTMANKCQSVLDADVLNERGKQRGFSKRARLSTPFRFGLAVVASMATEQGITLADLHRQGKALWERDAAYQAFYTPLLTSTAPEFFRTALCHILGQLTRKVLGCEAGQALRAFNRRILQDGRSFALHQALAEVLPGRCTAVSPAAVALHCTLDLLQEAPLTIAMSPDTDSEHDYRPAPESLRGDVVLADRGYLDLASWRDIDRQGGFFIVRGKAGLHPRVLDASREDGQRITACQERAFQAILSKCPKRQRAALAVEWLIEGEPCRLRLIVRWHPETKGFDDLFTPLSQDREGIHMLCLGYKRRWHGELLLKEWKSSTNLHKWDTAQATSAEAVIWASLAASALQRCLAPAPAHLLAVVISTRKASMPSAYDLPALFRALRPGDGPWYRRAFKAMIHYLGKNAKRAHPERDARTGRARLGLKPIFQLSEQQTLPDHSEQPAAA